IYVSRCTGACWNQNRTLRDRNAELGDERLQVLLPHPHLPHEPFSRIRRIPGRYKTLSHQGPWAAAEGSTYYWTISPASRACHRVCAAVSRPLRLLALSRRMIDSVRWPEAVQAELAGSRPQAQPLTLSSEGSYEPSLDSVKGCACGRDPASSACTASGHRTESIIRRESASSRKGLDTAAHTRWQARLAGDMVQ